MASTLWEYRLNRSVADKLIEDGSEVDSKTVLHALGDINMRLRRRGYCVFADDARYHDLFPESIFLVGDSSLEPDDDLLDVVDDTPPFNHEGLYHDGLTYHELQEGARDYAETVST